MKHNVSDSDLERLRLLESCELNPADFHHREHIQLAYTLLVLENIDSARDRLRAALVRFLESIGVSKDFYNETLTCAWLLAVTHFMQQSEGSGDSESFLKMNPILLDKRIMYTHYTEDFLKSEPAKLAYLPPNLEPIPLYGVSA